MAVCVPRTDIKHAFKHPSMRLHYPETEELNANEFKTLPEGRVKQWMT